MENAKLSRRRMWVIFAYFAALTLLIGLGGGLAGLPIIFYLKDKLKLGPEQMAFFNVLTGIPSYIGFLFGFLRDRWRPFGWGDRGYLFLMPMAMAAGFLGQSFLPLSYGNLVALALINGFAGTMLGAAFNGLTTSVAQRHLMTGRLTAVGSFIGVVPAILSSLLGGYLTEKVSPHIIFRVCAGLMALTGIIALWRPGAVFDGEPETHPTGGEPLGAAIRRLFRHRPLWPTTALQLLWVLMPGWGTPLFFYMTNTVKLNPTQIGVVFSTAPACALATSLLYGLVCERIPLRRLLLIGVIAGIIGAPIAMLIHGYASAIVVFVTAMALFGIGNCALNDLSLRSYPKGLEGTGAMLIGAVGAGAAAGSNLFGAWLYHISGFGMAMLISTLCTAAMLPILPLIPRSVTAARDGEEVTGEDSPPSSSALTPA